MLAGYLPCCSIKLKINNFEQYSYLSRVDFNGISIVPALIYIFFQLSRSSRNLWKCVVTVTSNHKVALLVSDAKRKEDLVHAYSGKPSFSNNLLKTLLQLSLQKHNYSKGPSIKDVRSQVGGGLSNSDKGRGFFRCGRPHFLVQNNVGLFEIYGVSARTRERRDWASADILRTRGGQFFTILCGYFLWTAAK